MTERVRLEEEGIHADLLWGVGPKVCWSIERQNTEERVSAYASANLEKKGFQLGGVRLVALFVGFVLCVGVARPALAEDAAPEPENPWAFTLEPYAWVAGLEGKVGSDQSPSIAGSTTVDLLEHFRGAFMGAASARYKRIGIIADGNWVRVGDNVPLRFSGITGLTDVDVTVDIAFGTAAAFFRFHPAEGLTLDPYLGARWWYLDANLGFNPGGPQVDPDRAWADFVAGLELNYDITDRWFIEAAADVGGGASKVTWQLYGGTGYKLKEWLALSAGWRYIGVDYDKDGFLFNATLDGMLIGFKIRL